MPTSYKGLTIPLSSDLADGPAAFRDYTDTLPVSDTIKALDAGTLGPYRIFPTAVEREAWTTAPNGAMAMVATDNEPYVRVGGVWRAATPGRVWEFTIGQTFASIDYTPINISPAVGTLRPDARRWTFDVFFVVEPTTPIPLPTSFTLQFNASGGALEQAINMYAHITFEGLYARWYFSGVLTGVVISMNNNMRIAGGGRLLITDGGMV